MKWQLMRRRSVPRFLAAVFAARDWAGRSRNCGIVDFEPIATASGGNHDIPVMRRQ